MGKCKQCGVAVREAKVCPLCGQVLEAGQGTQAVRLNGYPDIRQKTRILTRIVWFYFFFSIVAGAGLIWINYRTNQEIGWSFICCGALAYLYMTLKYSIVNNTGYVMKILIQTIGAVLLAIWSDKVMGFHGWSLDFVMPSAIILVGILTVILMVVNSANWQSYITVQIFLVLAGGVSVGLYASGLVKHPALSFLAAGMSLVFFVGTLIFGDRRAKSELKRRFHL